MGTISQIHIQLHFPSYFLITWLSRSSSTNILQPLIYIAQQLAGKAAPKSHMQFPLRNIGDTKTSMRKDGRETTSGKP